MAFSSIPPHQDGSALETCGENVQALHKGFINLFLCRIHRLLVAQSFGHFSRFEGQGGGGSCRNHRGLRIILRGSGHPKREEAGRQDTEDRQNQDEGDKRGSGAFFVHLGLVR